MHQKESFFLALFISYLNFCSAASDNDPKFNVSYLPPPPHRPPPRPPKPTTSPPSSAFTPAPSTPSNTTSTASDITGGTSYYSHRCKVGSDSYTSYSSTIVTEPGLLYIYTFSSTECAGFIHWWTICLWSKLQGASGSVTLLVLRNSSSGAYKVASEQTYDVEVVGHNYDQPACVQLRNKDEVMVKEGDFLGFICNGMIHMAIAVQPPQSEEEHSAAFRVYQRQYKSFNLTLEMSLMAPIIRDVKLNLSVVPQMTAILG